MEIIGNILVLILWLLSQMLGFAHGISSWSPERLAKSPLISCNQEMSTRDWSGKMTRSKSFAGPAAVSGQLCFSNQGRQKQ
jgi:hypothetical protein